MSSFTFVDIVVLYNLTQILGDCQLFADNLELHIPVLGINGLFTFGFANGVVSKVD